MGEGSSSKFWMGLFPQPWHDLGQRQESTYNSMDYPSTFPRIHPQVHQLEWKWEVDSVRDGQ